MARRPFGPADFGQRVSSVDTRGQGGAPSAQITGALGEAVHRFGGKVREIADETLTREGLSDAAADTQAGTLAVRGGRGARNRAYDTAAREQMSAQRRSAFADAVDQALTANPESPTNFGEAVAAARAAFTPTGDAQLDLDFEQFATLTTGRALSQVRAGEERRRVDVARGAFVTSINTERAELDRAVRAAPLDETGSGMVAAQMSRFAGQLARYGPAEAFEIGGVRFEADPDRLGVIDVQTLARAYDETQEAARTQWIMAAFDGIEGSQGKAAFQGNVRERWQSGDPMFAGLTGEAVDALDRRMGAEVNRAASSERAAVTAAAGQARDLLRALEYGGDVDPEELRAMARASGDVGLIVEADYRLAHGWESGPGARGGQWRGVAGAGFDSYAGFLLNDLEGSGLVGDDNGAGRARWGITERSHPDAWRAGDVSEAQARAIYRREYWDAMNGDNLPPDLAVVAVSAAVVGGVGTARQLLRESGGDPERFLQLEMARFERLAAQNPARYADDLPGWRNRQAKIRGYLSALQGNMREQAGFAGDPMSYAMGSRTRPALTNVAAIDLAAPLTDGGDLGAWGQALRQRRAAGLQLSQQYSVPPRMLTDADATFYRDQIAASPAAAVQLARAAGQAVGVEGARDLLREVGRTGGGLELHVASLAANPQSAGFVNRVVEGMVLRADGARAPSYESGERRIEQVGQDYAPALSGLPGLLSSAAQAAEAARLADAQRGMVRSAGYYLNGALGATERDGAIYGGVVRVNGAPALAPDWLRADRLDDALDLAADLWVRHDEGPVYSNGRPMERGALRRLQPRAMPNGRYQLVNPATGEAVPARSGAAFEFNIEAESFRRLLETRVPGSVMRGR
ncbi:MAG: glycosyl hydrolase 108 family protein [Brevundimonas sp.]|uniref:glycosyl hydrolase 108 family protein n=1 Tax=Brevundimonas sp. TaxID=1871086 RepID=UPI0039194132